ncbi:MAG: radical SAM protein [Pseudomonadota bacterium]
MHIRFAQVEPTTRCNFTCGFCAGRHMPQQDLPLETFRAFIDQVEGLEALELQGEGEPLLHPHFFDMIALAREKFPNLEISMITNGSMFSQKNIDKILDHGIARIFVSVESVDDEQFQRIRGGKLARLRSGVPALKKARDERGLEYPLIGLATTILRSTLGELTQAIPDFYRTLGFDGGITLQPLQAMPQYAQFYDEHTRAELLDARSMQAANTAVRQSVELNAIMRERRQSRDTGFYEKLYTSVNPTRQCPWLSNGIYMSTTGQLLPCCMTKDYQTDALENIHRIERQGQNKGRELLAQRARMQEQLSCGQIPHSCRGCETAKAIVRQS